MIARFRQLSGIGALAIALAAPPALADVKAGVDAWSRGDFAAAVAAWQLPATQGDSDAQFDLAQAYRLGRGVRPDLARAEELFGKAAAQGHINASDYYGLLLFQRGERARALPYITAAADRGEPRAQYLLGIANFNGDTVPKNWVRGYALVSLA
jgi:TPR repeat protein